MRDKRQSRFLTCAVSAILAGVLVVPAVAMAEGGMGIAGNDEPELVDSAETSSHNVAEDGVIEVGEGSDHESILAALQATDDGGTDPQTRTVKLVGDINNGPGFSVFDHDTLTIDLNGHKLNLAGNSLGISVSGTLVVKDSAAKSVSPIVDEDTGAVAYESQGEIVFGSSSIISAQGSTSSLKLESGTVSSTSHGCIRVTNEGSFEMTGGLIDSEDGFAVEVNDGGSFQMTGGVARAEDYSAIMGDDSSNRGDTRILIDGGYVLSVNTGTSGSFVGVGACQVMEGGILQMDSGTIRAVGNGVGAIVEYGSFRLNDGEIYGDGTGFSGETAGRIPIDDGHGLVLYAAKAGTEINGGFISGTESDDGSYPVPSVKIADAVALSANGARTMSVDELEPVDAGVEIKGGTYTNFAGMDSYVAESYRKLGHSADGRSSWVTVMQLMIESETKTGNSVSGSVITGRTAYVFYGQMDYYRGNIAKETVEYVSASDGGALTGHSASVYVDYPVFGDEYVFSGWFTDLEATGEKKPNKDDMVHDDVTDGNAYAKLSDAELMHVVFNTSSNLWDGVEGNDDTAQMTAFALVDSGSFVEVGLRTQFGDGNKYPEYTLYRALAKMPESLNYVDQYGDRHIQWAYQLNPVATYISGARLSNISTTDDIDDLYYAYQWWITIDGTHVEGSWWNMSISSYLKTNYPQNDLGVE